MITTQHKGRLVALCVILFLAFAVFLGITHSTTADAVSFISHPLHPLHSGRALRIAQVDEVFDDMPLAASTAPAQTVSMKWQWQPDTVSTVADTETQYIGRGVALIPTYGNPNSGRSWRISHL